MKFTLKNYIILLSALAAAFLLIFFYRFGFNYYAPLKSWIDSATFFNNALTPILLGVTSILIYATWSTSKKELEATNSALSLDLNFKIFEGMLKTFVENLEHDVEQEIKDHAFEDTWVYLTSYLASKYTFLKNFVEKYYPESAKSDLRDECLKLNIKNVDCLKKYGSMDEIYEFTESDDLNTKFIQVFENKIGNYFVEANYRNNYSDPKIIRNFLDILQFIDRNKANDSNTIKLINYLAFYIEPGIISKLSLNKVISNHPIYKLLHSKQV